MSFFRHAGTSNSAEENVNGQLLDELLAMARRDTDMRAHLLQAGKLYGEYADEMQQIHEENAKRLSEIVDRHGWPGVSIVGLEGCAAWLIAQHSNCTPMSASRIGMNSARSRSVLAAEHRNPNQTPGATDMSRSAETLCLRAAGSR